MTAPSAYAQVSLSAETRTSAILCYQVLVRSLQWPMGPNPLTDLEIVVVWLGILPTICLLRNLMLTKVGGLSKNQLPREPLC